jgi:outer membrane protein assembly factor BamA
MTVIVLFICLTVVFPLSIVQTIPVKPELHVQAVQDTSTADTGSFRRVRLLLLPIIFKSPDTGFAGGILPQLIFRNSAEGNPSSIRLDAYYTQKKQYTILVRPTLWFRGDRLNMTGRFALKDWPTSYYGIGNNTPTEGSESFSERILETTAEGTYQISPGIFTGAGYSLRTGRITADDENGELAGGTITGSRNTIVSGLLGVLKRDTRNNHYFPTRGVLHRIEFFTSLKALGSDHGFTRSTLDMRFYIPLHSDQTIAIQGKAILTTGDVPFRMLSTVGNDLRGYSSVRHIDRHLIAIQAEYRVVPVAWRIGLTVFAGVGDVFERTSDIRLNRLKYNAGLGIRYIFSRSEKINIRFDYGIGRNSSGDYIDLTEVY